MPKTLCEWINEQKPRFVINNLNFNFISIELWAKFKDAKINEGNQEKS